METPRFRVLLIGQADTRDVPPPLSFWFLNRADADVVADLSRDEAVGVAVLEYPEIGQVRLVRYDGDPAAQAWLQGNMTSFEGPSVEEATFFAPGPARRRARYRRHVQAA